MNPARKLCDIELPPVAIEKNLRIQYGFEIDGAFKGIAYHNITDDIKIPILKRFFGDHYHNYDMTLMVINHHVIPPHTDSDTLTVINIYIETGQAVTTFYEKRGTPKEYKLLNQTDGSMYHPDDLQQIFSFKAQPFEAWILNVSKIHSVTMPQPGIRMAYCIMSSAPFETVLADYERAQSVHAVQSVQTLQSDPTEPNEPSLYFGYFIVLSIIIIIVLWLIYHKNK
jgi:hypothetical protein